MEKKPIRFIYKFRQSNKHCFSCNAACCGPNRYLELSKEEARFLRDAGTSVERTEDIQTGFDTSNIHVLNTKCGYVTNKNGHQLCKAYRNPRRPAVCRKFKAGGALCKEIRRNAILKQF